MALAMPSWACTATRWTSPLVRVALVATTARVVLPPGGTGSGRSPPWSGAASRSRRAGPAPPGTPASPNAPPPVSSTAETLSTWAWGWSRSVSRVPGPPPRTLAAATFPGGGTTTVQPVSPTGSVQCPTARSSIPSATAAASGPRDPADAGAPALPGGRLGRDLVLGQHLVGEGGDLGVERLVLLQEGAVTGVLEDQQARPGDLVGHVPGRGRRGQPVLVDGVDVGRADQDQPGHPAAQLLGELLGELEGGDPAHRVGDHHHPLLAGPVQHRLEVAGQRLERVVVLAGPPRASVAALVVEHAPVPPGQVAPLVVPGVLIQREPVGEHQAGPLPQLLDMQPGPVVTGQLGRRPPDLPERLPRLRVLPLPVPPDQRPLQGHPGPDPEQQPAGQQPDPAHGQRRRWPVDSRARSIPPW